jgi:hypothetical protein
VALGLWELDVDAEEGESNQCTRRVPSPRVGKRSFLQSVSSSPFVLGHTFLVVHYTIDSNDETCVNLSVIGEAVAMKK